MLAKQEVRSLYHWMDTATDAELSEKLASVEKLLLVLTDPDTIRTGEWIREKIQEELGVRKELNKLLSK